MRDKRGFTLIELLIVLVIIGITSGIALFAFGDFGTSRKIVIAAEQFTSWVKLIQQKAILESTTFGISVEKNGYATFRLEDGTQWQPVIKPGLFHWHAFPKESHVIFNKKTSRLKNEPNIVIYPSGDLSSFTLFFSSNSETNLVTLTGKPNGELVLTHPSDK